MRAIRALRTLTTVSSKPLKTNLNLTILSRFYSAQPEEEDDSVFDSSQYTTPSSSSDTSAKTTRLPTWDDKYRAKVDRTIFGKETQNARIVEEEEEGRTRRAAVLAKALLEAALAREDDDEDEVVKEEDQKSLSVGIIGAPNAGKSALTNFMVGTKVAAVSRKTNTTTHEVLGVMTKGNTQICFFDTPGLMLKKSGFPYNDMKVRVESAWSSVDLYDVLMVIFDVQRHLLRNSGEKTESFDDRSKIKKKEGEYRHAYAHICTDAENPVLLKNNSKPTQLKALTASGNMLVEGFSKVQASQQNSSGSKGNSENKMKKDIEELEEEENEESIAGGIRS